MLNYRQEFSVGDMVCALSDGREVGSERFLSRKYSIFMIKL